MQGAKIMMETLEKLGVKHSFGIPGGVVLNLYHELVASRIKHITTRHEQGATHAADGYARMSGHPGVVIVTSGPGATNTVTGIATAYMDSSPIVVFTGQVPTSVIGNDAFQEVDATGVTRPITKHNFLVRRTEEIAETIVKAFYIATTGRPGPVLVDLPKDVLTGEAEFKPPENVELRGYKPVLEGNPKQIQRAVELILTSKRPIVYAGGGVIISGASAELKKFVDKLNLPVALTLMGLGAYPGDSSRFLGMLGMHGTYVANMAINNSDLIIAAGVRFDDRVTGNVAYFAPNAKIIHIDIDPASISKSISVDIPIVGDAKNVLEKINEALVSMQRRELEKFKEGLKDWWRDINRWRMKYPLKYRNTRSRIKPQYVIGKVHEITKKEKTTIVTEVGQHQMWTAQFYSFKEPRSLITSGGLGTMGFGFPAAMGAKVAKPERIVIDIAGDGSFQMNIQELATCVENKIPVKVVIINNGYFGMVRQWQEIFYQKRYACSSFMQPDYVLLAKAYGAEGFRVKRPDRLEQVLRKAILDIHDKPVIVDVWVEREENVYPMVPPGSPLTEMILA